MGDALLETAETAGGMGVLLGRIISRVVRLNFDTTEFMRNMYKMGVKSVPIVIVTALFTLVARSRRRYGGYIVHLGVVLLFIGFVGKAWGIDKETSLHVGETYKVSRYNVTYVGSRMEVDTSKRMIFADVKVTYADSGEVAGQVSPAKFIYRKSPDMPTTEVAMLHSVKDDLYVVVGAVLAIVVFSLSAIAIPMVLDRDTDTITAAMTSLRAVQTNFDTMMLWALLIVVLVGIGFATMMIGMAVLLPLVGHATWHAYRDVVR